MGNDTPDWLDNDVVRARVYAKISVRDDGCWEWTGHRNSKGYGRYQFTGGRTLGAHRMVYAYHHGNLPNMDLDHLCRNRACCNPAHLEPVTKRTNTLRGVGVSAINAQKTHCSQGHLLEGRNLAALPGRSGFGERRCKRCHADSQRKYRSRKGRALAAQDAARG